MEHIKKLLVDHLNEKTIQAIVSNRRNKQASQKIVFRPFFEKNKLVIQKEEYKNNQVFHFNMTKDTAVEQICSFLQSDYKQLDLQCDECSYSALVSKKGVANIKSHCQQSIKKIDLSHNRQKKYILDSDQIIPFLVDLGVQTKEGKIVDKKYKKYKQINRFLEFVQDIVPSLEKGRRLKIIDFGCGKSYLTFAVYYYLKILNGFDIEMIGLDLKTDVIRHCNELAEKYGYDDLHFSEGDISSYEGTDEVDMVITLHACDTATDYALDKAVRWGAKVILSVPCCQHEINKQISNDMLKPLLKYGILKERFSALLTDAIRAELLEQMGYEVQILEFIDMEHTPKNLLIRAVKKRQPVLNSKKESALTAMCDELNCHGTLEQLFVSED